MECVNNCEFISFSDRRIYCKLYEEYLKFESNDLDGSTIVYRCHGCIKDERLSNEN